MENKFLVRQRQENYFSVRVKSVGGNFSAEQLDTIQMVAKNFGSGEVHLTSRQEISVHSIKSEDFPAVEKIFAAGNLKLSRLGACLKNITACQGKKICPSGLIDTISLAEKIERLHGTKKLPSKFTIGLSGCKNNCMKVEGNDIGIKGSLTPNHFAENCIYCGKCEKVCPTGAIEFSREENLLKINRSLCINCGRCFRNCMSRAIEVEQGYSVSICGILHLPFIEGEEKVLGIVDEVLKFFVANSKNHENLKSVLKKISANELASFLPDAHGSCHSCNFA